MSGYRRDRVSREDGKKRWCDRPYQCDRFPTQGSLLGTGDGLEGDLVNFSEIFSQSSCDRNFLSGTLVVRDIMMGSYSMASMWDTIADRISEVTGEPFVLNNRRAVGGGCINQGNAISDDRRRFFVKFNQASRLQMFEAEALGLQCMADTGTIRVPRPICTGVADRSAYIVLEWLDLGGSQASVAEEMGRQLAKMHRKGSRDRFGFDCDNTIGSTPQPNPWTEDWGEFFARHRLQFQLDLARRNGGNFEGGDRLVDRVPQLLGRRTVQPSLLHGDLWGGNASVTRDGEPVIFDPATYYGDREADIAMTELFGGFGFGFYRGYNEEWPLDSDYENRKSLYNLYHVLNHFNLFGGGYAGQAQRLIHQLL